MTTPKSPEQILEEYRDEQANIITFGGKDDKWLRSSMASLLCYMAERMKLPCYDEVFYDKDGNSFSNPYTLLLEEARRITNNE